MKSLSFRNYISNRPNNAIEVKGNVLKEYQRVLLEIADDITNVCIDNGIVCSLGGGSALGAIRHKGFIPWDDDIDFNISREYIDKFITEFENKYGYKYWIHTPEEKHNFGTVFIQIRKKGTVAKNFLYDGDECGVPVDIFPVENTFDNAFLRCLHGLLCMGMRFALVCRKMWANRNSFIQTAQGNKTSLFIVRLKIFIGFFTSVFSVDAWSHGAIKCCKMCHRKGKYVVIPSGRKYFFGEIYDCKMFEDIIPVDFEDRSYSVTKYFDSYLKNLYGDYMRIPPENKREFHILSELKL